MSDNTQELRENLEVAAVDFAKAWEKNNIQKMDSAIDTMVHIFNRSQTNQAVLEALDLYEKDMQGYNFTPEDYEGGEDTNALVADALKNSKEYVRKELSGKEPTHE